MSLKRISMLVPVVLVASFGMLASCGDKEAKPADAMEEASDDMDEAAEEVEEMADDAAEEAKDE